MNDYTPSEDQVRAAYVQFAHDDLCLHLDMAREDARRAIAKIKADAWTEGYRAGYEHGDPMGDTDFPPPNPHRIEEEA